MLDCLDAELLGSDFYCIQSTIKGVRAVLSRFAIWQLAGPLREHFN